ncbi:1-acyl-sn-glycerol-3-phosphate acyltransferase [candidate division KSB1 bacterium]|nr:1-acyl-sn-glycerol-3-phosphate acyltransferase [candidate division KSB1 bacterium]
MSHHFSNIYTVILYALLYGHTVIFLFLCLLVSYCAPRAVLFWFAKIWAHGIFVILGTRLRIHGRDNIPSKKRFMILANHASLFDIPALMTVFPNVSWLGREYLTRIPVFGHMLKRTNYVAIGKNPAMNVRLIIQKAILNSEKFVVALFPEGTRTRTGELQDFKRGFIHIMNGGGLDILPVVMLGLFEIKPKTRFTIKPFQTIDIIICPPIKRTWLINYSNDEIMKRVQDVFISNYTNQKRKPA